MVSGIIFIYLFESISDDRQRKWIIDSSLIDWYFYSCTNHSTNNIIIIRVYIYICRSRTSTEQTFRNVTVASKTIELSFVDDQYVRVSGLYCYLLSILYWYECKRLFCGLTPRNVMIHHSTMLYICFTW